MPASSGIAPVPIGISALKNDGYAVPMVKTIEAPAELPNNKYYVFWNCAYKDWDTANQPSPDTTRALVANQTQNGTIYLFHAVSNTNVSMLGEIIDTVRAAGYEFGLFGSD